MTNGEKQKAINALKISVPIMAVTQEEFADYIQTLNKIMDWLEQEPVLDKIRAEIIEDCGYSKDYVGAFTYSTIKLKTVLQIIDRYKAESEAEDGEV